MMIKTEVYGVTRFINIDHIVAAKYEKENDSEPSTLTLQSSNSSIAVATVTGKLADVTKKALEAVCDKTEGALRG